MSIVRDTIRAIRMTLVLWVLTAVIYPLVIWRVGQTFFPYQANVVWCKISKDKWWVGFDWSTLLL